MKKNWIALAIGIVGCLCFGQTSWKFEVASVKPAVTGRDPQGPSATLDPGMVSFRRTSLKNLLMRAYGLRSYQIQGPGWIDTERYDVDAKAPEGAPRGRIPAMLAGLLVERFQLVTRRETRQENVYVLTVGKNGPKLTRSQTQITGAELAPNLPANELESTTSRLSIPAVTVAHFANTLAVMVGSPVLDETGIEGVYDITLNVSRSEFTAMRGDAAATVPAQATEPTITLEAGLKELGLNWGSRKAPVEHLIVVSGAKVPVEN